MIANKLKELRIKAEETQVQIAKLLNVTQASYWRMEKGEQGLTAEMLRKICLHYNISADYLLGLPKGLPYPD